MTNPSLVKKSCDFVRGKVADKLVMLTAQMDTYLSEYENGDRKNMDDVLASSASAATPGAPSTSPPASMAMAMMPPPVEPPAVAEADGVPPLKRKRRFEQLQDMCR